MRPFTIRAPHEGDIPRLVEIAAIGARERAMSPSTTAADVHVEWTRPGFDRETMARVAEVDGVVVASASIGAEADQAYLGGYVLPEHRGKGIGTTFMEWGLEAARALPDARELWSSAAAERADAIDLLESHGFAYRRSWFRMVNGAPSASPDPVWPAGVALRTPSPDELVDAFVRAYNGSFIDHFNFHEARPDQIEHEVVNHPDADPSLWFFAYEGDALAGFCVNWIYGENRDRAQLGPIGTMRSHRGIGLGRALLRHSVRAAADRGAKEVGLGVDAENPNGAVKLYSSEGFEIRSEGRSFARTL